MKLLVGDRFKLYRWRNAISQPKQTSQDVSSELTKLPADDNITDEEIIPEPVVIRVYSTPPSQSLCESDSVPEHRDDSNTLFEKEPIDKTRDRNVACTVVSDASVANSTNQGAKSNFSIMQDFMTYEYEDDASLSEVDSREYEDDAAVRYALCRLSACKSGIEISIFDTIDAVSKFLNALPFHEELKSEIEGSITDTIDAFDQVLNAFTLQEEDIQAVTYRIDMASEQLPYWTRHV